MKRFTRILLILALSLVIASASFAFGDVGELITNGGFETKSSTSLPLGWSFDAYNTTTGAYGDSVEVEGYGMVGHVSSPTSNDARLLQSVAVEPNSYYAISCKIKTVGVSGGAGANISVLNCFAATPGVFGDTDWTTVALNGVTGPDQTSMDVCLRIGGYGSEASGEAWFDDVSVVKLSAAPAGQAMSLYMNNSGDGGVDKVDTKDKGLPYMGAVIVAAIATLVAFAIVYYKCIIVREPKVALTTDKKSSTGSTVIVLLIIGLILRVLCNCLFTSVSDPAYFGHSTDINCFMAWGDRVTSVGTSNFYSDTYFADYPPGYMYILGACSALKNLLGIGYGSAAHAFIVKLPAIIGDLAIAYMTFKLAKLFKRSDKNALVLMYTVLFNPVVVFISSIWGQIDMLLAAAIIGAILMFISGLVNEKPGAFNYRLLLAGLIYGFGVLIKPQALMAGPLLAVAFIVYIVKSGKKSGNYLMPIVNTLAAGLSAIALIFLLSIPFAGSQEGLWLIDKYAGTASSYNYASVEAYNLMALIGANWTNADSIMALGMSFKQWGTIFIVIISIGAIGMYLFGQKRSKYALVLSMAFMMAGIFTFGHFMHERYLFPVLILLVVAMIAYNDKRLFVSFGWFTVSMLINAAGAFLIIDNQAARSVNYGSLVTIGSAITVLGFIYLAYVCADILLNGKIHHAFSDKKAQTTAKAVVNEEIKETNAVNILPNPVDTKLHFKKKDWLFVCILTLVYCAVAVTNLGTTQAPQTEWTGNVSNGSVVFNFNDTVNISHIYVYGGIADKGSVAFLDVNGNVMATYTQEYGQMFRWHEAGTVSFSTTSVTMQVESGTVKLREVAFLDSNYDLIPGAAVSDETAAALTDEPEQVAESFSYLNGMYFDELYHGRTAYEHLNMLDSYENSHPPLGKIFISIGVALFGMTAFGWRIIGALFGVAMIPVIYCFAKRLFKKSEYALMVGTVFAFDFMHFAQTRIATIDVYGVFFILLMFYYMYQYFRMNFFVDGFWKTIKPLALAGLFFGLGAASKWICFYAGAGLAVLLFISLAKRFWEYKRIKAGEGSEADRQKVAKFWKYTVSTLALCCVFYLLVPIVIYSLSYLRYPDAVSAFNTDGLGGYMKRVWYYQDFMFSYHSGLTATHSFQSRWYEWMLDLRPIWFYRGDAGAMGLGAGQVSTISSFGNPLIWWTALAGTIGLIVQLIRKKIQATPGIVVALVGIAANLGPWIFITRCTFIYHYFATVPFIILCAAYFLKSLEIKYKWLDYIKWGWMAVAVVLFAAFYPFLSGLPTSQKYMELMQWLPRWTFLGSAGPKSGMIFGACVMLAIVAIFVGVGFIRYSQYKSKAQLVEAAQDEQPINDETADTKPDAKTRDWTEFETVDTKPDNSTDEQ